MKFRVFFSTKLSKFSEIALILAENCELEIVFEIQIDLRP